MLNFRDRIGFIVPKGTYPTVISDNTYSYYEQLCALVAVIGELNDEINSAVGEISGFQEQLDGKQDLLTFDEYPMAGSYNPVYSNGIRSEIRIVTDALQQAVTRLEGLINGKQDTLTFDTEPTQDSTNPVYSGGVYSAIRQSYLTLLDMINGKQDTLTFDSEPTNGSNNPVTSDGIYAALRILSTAIDDKQDALTFDSTPTEDSTNPVYSGGVFDFVKSLLNALTNTLTTNISAKQDKAISVTFSIDPFEWTPDNTNNTYYYEKTVTGVKANAALSVLNDDNTTQFSYAVGVDMIKVTTTGPVAQIVTFNIIAFNDPDVRT